MRLRQTFSLRQKYGNNLAILREYCHKYANLIIVPNCLLVQNSTIQACIVSPLKRAWIWLEHSYLVFSFYFYSSLSNHCDNHISPFMPFGILYLFFSFYLSKRFLYGLSTMAFSSRHKRTASHVRPAFVFCSWFLAVSNQRVFTEATALSRLT